MEGAGKAALPLVMGTLGHLAEIRGQSEENVPVLCTPVREDPLLVGQQWKKCAGLCILVSEDIFKKLKASNEVCASV
jgi:hypothetical protein